MSYFIHKRCIAYIKNVRKLLKLIRDWLDNVKVNILASLEIKIYNHKYQLKKLIFTILYFKFKITNVKFKNQNIL